MGYVHDVAMSQFVPPNAFGYSAGTWTLVAATNVWSLDRTAADASFTVYMPIPIPSNSVALKGAKLVSVFLCPPSWEELERRLVERGTDTPEVIDRRLANARGEVEYAGRYRYWVVNDDIERAVDRMQAVIQAEECRRVAFDRSPLS